MRYFNKKSIIFGIVLILIFLLVLIINCKKIYSYVYIKKYQSQINRWELYPQENAVNIVFITDRNYIDQTNVAIYSAIKNKNVNTKYNFYIIGIDLSESDIKELTKQSTKETPILVIVNKNIYDFYLFRHNTHVPILDCYKFNIPDIFPNFDKILYLDGDILVQKDLRDLYDIDLYDFYAAALLGDYDYSTFNYQAIDLKLKKYSNNGVMLLNLDKMRKDHIPDKLLIYKIFKAPRLLITQDTFKAVLKDKVIGFDETYNICSNFIDVKKIPDINKYLKSGAIIHFAGRIKPWDNPKILYGEVWNKYNQEFTDKYKSSNNK